MKTQLKTKTNLAMAVMVGISASAILGAMAMIAVSARNVLTNKNSSVASVRDAILREDGFPVGVPTLIYSVPDTSKIENISLWDNKLAIREVNSASGPEISLINIMTRAKTTLDLGGLQPKGYIDINADNLVFGAPSSTDSIFLYNFSSTGITQISGLGDKAFNPAIDASSSKAVWYEVDAGGVENLVEYNTYTRIKINLDYPRSSEFAGEKFWGKSDLSYNYRTYNNLRGISVQDIFGRFVRDSLRPTESIQYLLHTANYNDRMVSVLESGVDYAVTGGVMLDPSLYKTSLQFRQFRINDATEEILTEKRDIKTTEIGDPVLRINDVAIHDNKIAWIEDNSRIYVYVIPTAWRNLFACNDSDGGRSYTTFGTASANAISQNDYCMDSNKLVEFYCSRTESFTSVTQNCSSLGVGMVCSDGKCVRSTGTSGSTTSGSIGATSTRPIER